MKLQLFTFLLSAATVASQAADATLNLTEPKDRTSYALGVNFGSNLKNQGVEANLDIIRRGIEDALAGKPQLNETELRDTFNTLRTQIAARRDEKAKENKTIGEKFLAEHAAKEGIKKTDSGLLYKIVAEGSGPSPSATDEVSVKYTGKLIDGTVFDSTDKAGGAPRRFGVSRVIQGWSEALQKMKKGARWELAIPSALAYGERGNPNIPGNSVLLFDVEVVDIHAAAPVTTGAVNQPVTSDIIKVPSAEELAKGAKIEVIKPEDVDKEIAKEKARKDAEGKKP